MTQHDSTSSDQQRTLLELARTFDHRPVALIRTCLERDGLDWLDTALEGSGADPSTMTLDALKSLHTRSKTAFAAAKTPDDAASASLGYLLAIATAKVGHDVTLSNQPPELLADTLFDLAPDLPDPLGDLCARAAIAMS